MIFNSAKTAFGRHETFALRYSWLTKGYQQSVLSPSEDLFGSKQATVKLGVGKNMVLAIRYWLRASQIMCPDSNEMTSIGQAIFDAETGFDPFLQDEATLWLIHWLIASNPTLATSWYWFFNKFHKPTFSAVELNTALGDWIKANVDNKVAEGTIKNDALLLPKMYAFAKNNTRMTLEDKLDIPLAQLNLIEQSTDNKSFLSKPSSRDSLPIEILAFALCQIIEEKHSMAIPIEELMYSRDQHPALGSVFRLTENALIAKLEDLADRYPDYFDIRESSGIHQMYSKKPIGPESFLGYYYEQAEKEAMA